MSYPSLSIPAQRYTPPLYERITHADVVTDAYTEPVRDPAKLSNFWHPSDHRPIVVDFNMK